MMSDFQSFSSFFRQVCISGALFSVFASAVCSAAGIIYDNGPPDPNGGLSAREMTKFLQADDFYLSTPTRVESVKLWDYENNTTFYGSFLWQIYANKSDNTPGTLLHSGMSGNLAHTPTGTSFFNYDEYVTTFTIAPIALSAGRYWLALHNGPLSHVTGYVFWQATNRTGTCPSQGQGLVAPYDRFWFSHDDPGYLSEFAFQINGIVGPIIRSISSNSGITQISFTSTLGENYRVEYKNNLGETWSTVLGADNVSGTGEVIQVTDSDPNLRGLPRRFYRVLLL